MRSGIPRGELFLADKLSFPQSFSSAGVRNSVQASLSKLKTNYLDLYMLHSIGPSDAARAEAWREMEALQVTVAISLTGACTYVKRAALRATTRMKRFTLTRARASMCAA